ncbi:MULTISPECIES: hypothetical protein [unclassified Nocardiopsis]|uniref:hypothetical protein n=1 Tax=unclassified Nocardiopsis TaxID=2649073 RepID=UPI001356BDA4|nr:MULTISPECIES: hypothetical protein [unclassified Nocardiopsis]
MPHLSAATLSNVETGRPDENGRRRRQVTVDELMTLAIALQVAPVHLLVPLDTGGRSRVTPNSDEMALRTRDFIRGFRPLPGMSGRDYYSEVPEDEFYEYSRLPGDDGMAQHHLKYVAPPRHEEEGDSDAGR